MKKAMVASIPRPLRYGEWHAPYVNDFEYDELGSLVPIVSAARCARVSYNNHDGSHPKVLLDISLFERLALAKPPHMSPLEHQARPALKNSPSRNYVGWSQFRDVFETVGWRDYGVA